MLQNDKHNENQANIPADEEMEQFLFTTELYMGKPLSNHDLEEVQFIIDELKFPVSLMDYLVEYCVQNGHKSFRYISTVARAWADKGIRSVEDAKRFHGKSIAYNKYFSDCQVILKELGIYSRDPVPSDLEFVEKWMDEWNISLDVILQACRRTISAIGKPSFHYVNSILDSWHDKGIKTVDDILQADAAYSAKMERQEEAKREKARNLYPFLLCINPNQKVKIVTERNEVLFEGKSDGTPYGLMSQYSIKKQSVKTDGEYLYIEVCEHA